MSNCSNALKKNHSPLLVEVSETHGADSVSMAELMTRMRSELEALAHAADDLQQTIAPMVADQNSPQENRSKAVQSLDSVSQTLTELAAFSGSLSSSLPDGWTVNTQTAASRLRLEDLARRLNGQKETKDTASHVAGDCDFF